MAEGTLGCLHDAVSPLVLWWPKLFDGWVWKDKACVTHEAATGGGWGNGTANPFATGNGNGVGRHGNYGDGYGNGFGNGGDE